MALADYAALECNPANHSPLTPLSLLRRSALVHGQRTAIIDGDLRLTYRQFHERCQRLAAALAARGIGRGDTVAIMCRNRWEMLVARFGVPLLGAVLNPINTRLDGATVAFMLDHGRARLFLVDSVFAEVATAALAALADMDDPPAIVVIGDHGDHGDSAGSGSGNPAPGLARLAGEHFDDLIAQGHTDLSAPDIDDEWAAITLSYTSGTTGDPKGVVYHHRGAYLAALANAMAFGVTVDSVYLWTLPMFHCDGWGYVWAVTAMGATHVCLPGIDSAAIHDCIERHGVTHMCGAPIVLNTLLADFGAADIRLSRPVAFALGGAAPPAQVIRRAGAIGFDVSHLYGLTETYGPAALCVEQPEWLQLDIDRLAQRMARQGVASYAIDDVAVLDDDGRPVVADANTLGEVCVRGNTVMAGYLRNPERTAQAFAGGWFHTGDLAVMHSDGYVEIKDRAKDIIISGGENISSLEVEDVLYEHHAVAQAAVVAQPDARWGESPCAFVMLHPAAVVDEAELIAFCRERMAHFKVPRRFVFGDLPKTATGKIRKNILRERARD